MHLPCRVELNRTLQPATASTGAAAWLSLPGNACPGQVNADLWSEHFARYAFARRFAESKWALDAGCGTGYGAAELAQSARSVIGFDLSPGAALTPSETIR